MMSVPINVMRVAVITAMASSLSAGFTVPEHTVRVRPGFNTDAETRYLSDLAGRRRLILYSTVSTAASAGISEKAAYPQAESRAVAMAPACLNPCCWVKSS